MVVRVRVPLAALALSKNGAKGYTARGTCVQQEWCKGVHRSRHLRLQRDISLYHSNIALSIINKMKPRIMAADNCI